MRRPYVYELVDKLTGKWYVGSRSGNGCHPSELGLTYFTSSRLLKPIFQANPTRFVLKILVEADVEYVIKTEASILKFRNAKSDNMSYNMHNGDGKMNTVKSGKLALLMKAGFHSMSFEEKSERSKKNGNRSFELSKGIHARTSEQMSIDGKKSYDMKVGIHARTFNQMSETGKRNGLFSYQNKIGMFAMTLDDKRKVGKLSGGLSSKTRYKCGCCEMVTTAAGLGNHFKKTGHSGKIKLY